MHHEKQYFSRKIQFHIDRDVFCNQRPNQSNQRDKLQQEGSIF